MQLTTTRTILSAAALIFLASGLGRAVSTPPGRTGPDARARQRRSQRGAYLVRAMGCNDCHTPWKLGPKGPEPDMSRALSGHPADFVDAAPTEVVRTMDVERRGHQHGVRRPVGHQLHGQPDAGRRDRPRQVDPGNVHRHVEDRTARRQGPAAAAADAVADDPHAHRRGSARGIRLPAVPPSHPQSRSRPRSIRTISNDPPARVRRVPRAAADGCPSAAAASRGGPQLRRSGAADAPRRDGTVRAGRQRRHRRRQSPVRAAVPALDRRRRQAAMDPPARRHDHRRQQPAPVGISRRHAAVEGVQLRRPSGRNALPVESVGRRMARGQLRLEQGRNRRGAGRRPTASPARWRSPRDGSTTSRRAAIARPATARRAARSASILCNCRTTAIRTRFTASR